MGIWINKRVVKGGHLSSKGRGYIFMMSGEGGSIYIYDEW